MPSEPAIRVLGVSKSFAAPSAQGSWRARLRPGSAQIQALRQVGFEVGRGENFGIVGHNGAGKSTLLRILCGIHAPDKGSVEVRGKVSPVVGLGTGFRPEFTGRENVYLKSAVLGMTRTQVEEGFDAIADFADLGRFLDEPLQTYSDGMRARLAFAIAFSCEPEILVIDEALSVGDEGFRRKCGERIGAFLAGNTTVVLTSHGPSQLEACDRLLLLDAGQALRIDEPGKVLPAYGELLKASAAERAVLRKRLLREMGTQEGPAQPEPPAAEAEGGALPAAAGVALRAEVVDASGRPVTTLAPRTAYRFRVRLRFDCRAKGVRVGLRVNAGNGMPLATLMSEPLALLEKVEPGLEVDVDLPFENRLAAGTYFVDAQVAGTTDAGPASLHHGRDVLTLAVEGDAEGAGFVDLTPRS